MSSRRLRALALVAAAVLPLAGVALAAPAQAADPTPTIQLSQTEFPAGDWQDGFEVTGSGFDGTVNTVEIIVGSDGENGGGAVYIADAAVNPDGTFGPISVVPDQPVQSPAANGFPTYYVFASQRIAGATPDDTVWVNSQQIQLTITAGTSATLPEQVAVNTLASGVPVSFAGFSAGEEVNVEAGLFRDGEPVGDAVEQTVEADATGAGSFSLAFADAQQGDYVVVNFTGVESARQAQAFASVVAAEVAPAPAPTTPAAPAANGNQLANTGSELGLGFMAAVLMLAIGTGVVVTRRRLARR